MLGVRFPLLHPRKVELTVRSDPVFVVLVPPITGGLERVLNYFPGQAVNKAEGVGVGSQFLGRTRREATQLPDSVDDHRQRGVT